MSSRGKISAALLFGANKWSHANDISAVPGRRREMHNARIVDHEGLSPTIKDMPPWITARSPAEHSQLARAWIELVDTAVEVPHDPVLRFNLRVQKDTFLEIEPAAWPTPPRTYRMVTVLNPKSCQH